MLTEECQLVNVLQKLQWIYEVQGRNDVFRTWSLLPPNCYNPGTMRTLRAFSMENKLCHLHSAKNNIFLQMEEKHLTFTQCVVFKPQSLRQGFACTCLTEKRMTEPKQGRRSSLETLWSQQEVGPCKVLQRALAIALLSLYSLQTRGQSFKWSHQLVLDCKLQDET